MSTFNQSAIYPRVFPKIPETPREAHPGGQPAAPGRASLAPGRYEPSEIAHTPQPPTSRRTRICSARGGGGGGHRKMKDGKKQVLSGLYYNGSRSQNGPAFSF